MATTSRGDTFEFQDYRGWEIAAARERHRRWHGFARPLGDPRERFTLTAGPANSREAALEAIRARVDEQGA